MTQTLPGHGGGLAVATAVAGTVLIAAGAFWLSFTALADLARRSGIDRGQAWAWPLIVDGIIVVATVAVVALAGHRTAWYPWMLLIVGAGLSVTANSIHAVVAADVDVAPGLAASVAAVPPLVLLAITHLTVILTRHRTISVPPSEEGTRVREFELAVASTVQTPPPALEPLGQIPDVRDVAPRVRQTAPQELGAVERPRRERAARFRAEGWSNKKIARELGVHPSTVGRWLPQPEPELKGDAEATTPQPHSSEKQEKEK